MGRRSAAGPPAAPEDACRRRVFSARRQRHQRVAEALELVGIADRHDHFPRQLSGGQEQRVAIARAIVTRPAIVVADEPTGDLDKPSAHAIMRLLQDVNQNRGATVIMVTHDPATTGYARRTLHLEKGRLVKDQSAPSPLAKEALA